MASAFWMLKFLAEEGETEGRGETEEKREEHGTESENPSECYDGTLGHGAFHTNTQTHTNHLTDG